MMLSTEHVKTNRQVIAEVVVLWHSIIPVLGVLSSLAFRAHLRSFSSLMTFRSGWHKGGCFPSNLFTSFVFSSHRVVFSFFVFCFCLSLVLCSVFIYKFDDFRCQPLFVLFISPVSVDYFIFDVNCCTLLQIWLVYHGELASTSDWRFRLPWRRSDRYCIHGPSCDAIGWDWLWASIFATI